MYVPVHYAVQELVPESIYLLLGKKALRLFNPGLLMSADTIRDRHGISIVNTWHSPALQKMMGGKILSQRGLRNYEFFMERCAFDKLKAFMMFEAYFGGHRYGESLDITTMDTPVEEVRQDIRDNPDDYPYITEIEKDVPWLHIGTRNVERLTEFAP